jgi:hypothetical protein
MASRHPDEFAARRPARRAHGGPGERRLVLVADEDEQRAGYAGCEAAWSVEGPSERSSLEHLPPPRKWSARESPSHRTSPC